MIRFAPAKDPIAVVCASVTQDFPGEILRVIFDSS